jgi:hypothetical protein
MNEILRIRFDGEKLHFQQENCYESRGDSVIKLTQSAFDLISTEVKKKMRNFDVFFYVGDKSHYPFSFCSSSRNIRTIPCHIFQSWPEVGIHDYELVRKEIIERSTQPVKHEKLFWIGNTATHPSRKFFVEACQKSIYKEKILAIDCGNWQGVNGEKKTPENKYVSLPDHCDYKYLLDLQGNGYSGRTKLLFHSGRPLFFQERSWNEYWFFDMKPFVHYIPLKEDLSDFTEKFRWAESNPEQCKSIANNAMEFCKNYLTRANAIDRYKSIILLLGGIDCTIT